MILFLLKLVLSHMTLRIFQDLGKAFLFWSPYQHSEIELCGLRFLVFLYVHVVFYFWIEPFWVNTELTNRFSSILTHAPYFLPFLILINRALSANTQNRNLDQANFQICHPNERVLVKCQELQKSFHLYLKWMSRHMFLFWAASTHMRCYVGLLFLPSPLWLTPRAPRRESSPFSCQNLNKDVYILL